MNEGEIKKLAELTFQEGVINQTVATFVLEKLSKSELKKYYGHLKRLIEKNNIVVKTAETLDSQTSAKFEKDFDGKEIQFETDPKLGAGVYVKIGDDIIDLTVKNYIDQTIQSIKNEL